MNDPVFPIRHYLAPPINSFWNWSDDGEVVTWNDGRTIAFRAELEAVLRRQASHGLPSLSLVLILLAACRESWSESTPAKLLSELTGSDESEGYWPYAPLELTQAEGDAFQRGLETVHNLPDELRRNLDLKSELVATVFEVSRRRSSVQLANAVVDAIADGVVREYAEMTESRSHVTWIEPEEMRELIAGLNRVDVESLRLRFQTGLESEVLPAEIEEPLATKIRRLFDRLESDEEFSGMVRMARNLLALVSLPRPLDQNDEIPVGGVSDISNRGTLDRLLLSELAQDDNTLMLRVAMNEALYLRRETPPRNPPRARLLVLDAGLRMWGVPRVYSTSVAMSFAAMTGGPIDLTVLCAVGGQLQPVDLSTREGLVEQLQILRPESHPGDALADLTRWRTAVDAESDVILVTCEDVLADGAFQRALAETDIGFLVTVSRSGAFRLMQRTMHGTKVLRTATLDVENLLKPAEKPHEPLIDADVSTELPAILGVRPFPLRLSHSVNPQQSWVVRHHGAFAVTNDRRLMHWDDPTRGGRQLLDRLPSRRVLWTRSHARGGLTQFVVGNSSESRLTLGVVNLDIGRCQLFPLDTAQSPVLTVCDHAGALFVIHRNEIDVCDMQTGELICSVPKPAGDRWVNGRYFQHNLTWKALSFNGVSAVFEEVPCPATFDNPSEPLVMFDVEEVQGPVAFSSEDGSLHFTAEQRKVELMTPRNCIDGLWRVSQDGRRLIVSERPDGFSYPEQYVAIDVMTGHSERVYGDPSAAVQPILWRYIRPQSYRNRILSIGVESGGLLLETKASYRLLHFDQQAGGRFRIGPNAPRKHTTRMHQFEPIEGVPGVRYKLRVATWSDGSKVFLDSRGLLHLKSSDPRIPEATFVLCDNEVSGWCALGAVWGTDYYLDSTVRIERERVHKMVFERFMIRLP